MPELTYDDWAYLLSLDYLSPANAGRRVYLYVDETTVEDLARFEAGEDEGLDSLLHAVAQHRGSGADSASFPWVVERFDDWYAGFRFHYGDAPPSLPLLAVSVLAATSMGADDRLAANDYYSRFRELLGMPQGGGMPEGFDASVVHLWQRLRKWMNDDEHGRLGVCTAEEHPQFVNIGWPLSQALWRGTDSRRLREVLDDLLRPGRPPPADERLLEAVRAWAPRAVLGSSALRFVTDRRWEPQLLATLHDEIAQWQEARQGSTAPAGTMRSTRWSASRSRLASTLKLWLRPELPSRLGLAAVRPESWPQDLTLIAPSGREVALRSDGGSHYDEVEHPVTAEMLALGLRLQGEGHVVALEPAPAYLLAQDRALGGRSTADRVRLYEPYQVLVEDSMRAEVERDLERLGAQPRLSRAARVPKGWALLTDVTLTDLGHVPSWLEDLAPRRVERLEVAGGLRASSQPFHYLLGEEPDVLLPDDVAGGSEVVLLVDGEQMTVPVREGRARLRELGLAEGAHEIRYGSASRALHVSRRGRWDWQYVTEQQPLGASADDARAVRVPRAVSDVPSPAQPAGGAADQYAAVVPRAARDVTLLGRSPGEVCCPQPQAAPKWLATVDLHSPDFETTVPFMPVWRVERWERAEHKTRCLAALEPCYDRRGDSAVRRRWAGEVLAAPQPAGEDAQALLERYRLVAKRVVASG